MDSTFFEKSNASPKDNYLLKKYFPKFSSIAKAMITGDVSMNFDGIPLDSHHFIITILRVCSNPGAVIR